MTPLLIGILGLLAFSVAAALFRERAVSNASHETYGALVVKTSRDRIAVVGWLVTLLVAFAGARYLFVLSQTAEATLFIGFLKLWLAMLLWQAIRCFRAVRELHFSGTFRRLFYASTSCQLVAYVFLGGAMALTVFVKV
jgi:Disulfide bond formation protein DsbB